MVAFCFLDQSNVAWSKLVSLMVKRRCPVLPTAYHLTLGHAHLRAGAMRRTEHVDCLAAPPVKPQQIIGVQFQNWAGLLTTMVLADLQSGYMVGGCGSCGCWCFLRAILGVPDFVCLGDFVVCTGKLQREVLVVPEVRNIDSRTPVYLT